MKVTKIYNWKENSKEKELKNVIESLKKDGLVILPTETVYGLAASAFSDQACQKIFAVKGRAQDNPLIVHVANKKMLDSIVEKPNEIEEKLIDHFMPGPFTLILNKKECICPTVTCHGQTVGIRMPSHSIIHKVIEESNLPLAAPSANLSSRPSGTCIEDIIEEFDGKVDILVDGGKCQIGIESTVVKVEEGVPVILRPGYITEEDIKKVIGKVKLSEHLFRTIKKDERIESPGMKYKHYAPKTKCVLVEAGENQIAKINKNLISQSDQCCVLGFMEDRNKIHISENRFISLGSKKNLQEISSNIFSSLRKVDTLNCELAIIEGLEENNLGLSIMNRLVRACENHIL